MDVRCEKCQTEYELDESRLKPGGVTVKCTNCGHMFKIRKRAQTNLGVPAVPAPTVSSGVPRAQTNTGVPGSGPTGDRQWIVRLANGEQRTCRELATLQQWILSGAVTRESMISRSGKTWKQLGDIPELAQFFDVADEARERRTTSPQQAQVVPAAGGGGKAVPEVKQTMLGGHGTPALPPVPNPNAARRPATQPPPPPKTLARASGPSDPILGGAAPANDDTPVRPVTQRSQPVATKTGVGAAPSMLAGAPAPGAMTERLPQAAPPPVPRGQTFATPNKPTSIPPAIPPAIAPQRSSGASGPVAGIPVGDEARRTGAWATEDVKPIPHGMHGGDGTGSFGGAVRPAGNNGDEGFGGAIRPVPTHDVAFASSLGGRAPSLSSPPPLVLDDDDAVVPVRQGGGVGKWIALGSLALIAGAAFAIYWTVLRDKGGDAKAGGTPGTATTDAGAVAAATDAGTTPDPVPDPVADDPLQAARDELLADSRPRMAAALDGLAKAEQTAASLALRARLLTAIAQQLEDEAAYASAKDAPALKKEAAQKVVEAAKLAQQALKKSADEPLAQVAMADVQRLQNKKKADVEKYLKRALELSSGDREARVVQALLALREKKPADAKTAALELERGDGAMEKSGDVRPRWLLARIALDAGDAPAAQEAAEAVVGVAPEHGGATAMLAKLRDTVATGDPMPPEDGGGSGSGTGTGTGTGSATGATPGTGGGGGGGGSDPEDYDKLLAKADRLAESNCGEAMPYYQKALAINPGGVAALTGAGYCHIDAKQFSSAHSMFRTALGISRKYEPALWGVAEAYQQQGLKEKAIDAYNAYLAVYPGTQKAIKQIERLGGSVDGGGGGDKPPDPDPPPDTGGGGGGEDPPPDNGGGEGTGSEPTPTPEE